MSEQTSTHKYRSGDRVIVRIDPGAELQPGRIVDPDGHPFCAVCHCDPADPEHYGDGSLCCPGPWYHVEITDPDVSHRAPMTFAEHELTKLPGV